MTTSDADNNMEDSNIETVDDHLDDKLHPSTSNKDVLGMNYRDLHFGTKEAPAVVQSIYSRIIVGCPGDAEEGHEMVWFWLDNDKPYECSVCSQYFKLEVVDIGGQTVG